MRKIRSFGIVASVVIASALLLAGCNAKPEIDLSNYIVIDGVSGLNGEGVAKYYFDDYLLLSDMTEQIPEDELEKMSEKELEKAMTKHAKMLEEVGNALDCITLSVTPEAGLSNGDTVTVKAVFENTDKFDFSYIFKDGTKTYPVSGLKDPIVTDPLSDEHIALSFSGLDGSGEATINVIAQGTDYPTFQYSLSESDGLCNGDTVTVTVQYNKSQLDQLGYRIPAVTERTYTVSGLTELFDISNGIPAEDLAALCDQAYDCALAKQEEEVNYGAEILSEAKLDAAFFLEVVTPGTTYQDYWHGLEMTNAVVVVSDFTLRYSGAFGYTRTYWILCFYPDCTAAEGGHLAYNTDNFDSYSVWKDTEDPEEFYKWFSEEFGEMNITRLDQQ